MKGKSVFSGLTEKLETNKKLKWMVYGALMLTALVIFLSSLGSKKENADNISTTTDQVVNSSAGVDSYAYQLECISHLPFDDFCRDARRWQSTGDVGP